MLYWVLQITVISIIFIFLVHYLFNFFKTTLTVPKIKDLVNSPSKKYEEIYNTISNKNNLIDNKLNYDISELLPKPDTDNMKMELKNFLKKQLNNNNVVSSDPNSFADKNLNTFAYNISEY